MSARGVVNRASYRREGESKKPKSVSVEIRLPAFYMELLRVARSRVVADCPGAVQADASYLRDVCMNKIEELFEAVTGMRAGEYLATKEGVTVQ